MKTLRTICEVRGYLRPLRNGGRRIGFVPTMGALHAGHRSLLEASVRDCEVTVASIFVNPRQFGPGEDFEKYPRVEASDLAICKAEGVDAVFSPGVEEIYPADAATRVIVSGLTEGLCGAHRPGHFDGVTTVVAVLFNIVQPDVAYFGQKDAQQAAVIQRMARDLAFPIEIVVCPTVREADGLAMSSRNAYLSREHRQQAVSLSRALNDARDRIAAGEHDVARLKQHMREIIESAGPAEIDYIETVDPDNMQPKSSASGRSLIALAVRIGPARLIDNVMVDTDAFAANNSEK